MILTTIAFVLLAIVLVAAQHRRGQRGIAVPSAPPLPCPRCAVALPIDAATCPSCHAPLTAYRVVNAPRVVEAAPDPAAAGAARPLHALVRADVCVGCGTCVDVCPEPGAIRVVDKRAVVDRQLCQGHARCQDACPVGAIFMSSGEGVQHVEVPDLSVHFESNVPGLYVVGELGGRGLIKNAINEGKLAIEHVAAGRANRRGGVPGGFDVIIVGSGPAGLSAALECHRAGLSAVILEQGTLADSIHKYPRKKLLLAEPTKTPLYGDLWVADASKEMLLQVWQQVIDRTPLDVRVAHRVERIERDDLGFAVHAGETVVRGDAVVLALGRRGTPRRLGVPGEERDGVYYDIVEMEAFAGQSVLVVGGGDSAIESAIGLAHQPGTRVALAYRGADFARAKERNRAHLEEAVAAGTVRLWLSTEVRAVGQGSVMLETQGERREEPVDAVIIRIGGEPPAAFLAAAGVRVVKKALALAGMIVAAAFAAGSLAPAAAQVSPGRLAAAHARLEGPTQCFQCHAGAGASSTGMDARCLACHGEIAALKAARRGLHARVGGATCASCHPDHAGRDFAMVAWPEGDPQRFDHARAGYPLQGAHADVPCRDCHQPRNQRDPIARSIRKVDRARTWLGLSPDCASCHADPHQNSLGAKCLSCHQLDRWEPASRFDHARTKYPLTGKHAAVDCAACHRAAALFAGHDTKPQATAVLRFAPEAHGSCADCHRDPHAGRMGAACEKCHATASFTAVKPGGFDHRRTRYPLLGAHARVACVACHDPKQAAGARPRFDACNACHADPHAGSATRSGRAVDCAACHGVASFRPSTFTVEAHASSPYPLTGRHRDVACERCHARKARGVAAPATTGVAGVQLRPPDGACADCHADAHGGQLAKRPDGGACESCHRVEGFRPSLITAREHQKFGLPLAGRHAAADCRSCHVTGKEPFRFALGKPACVSCHPDPHAGQFAGKAEPSACSSCHDANSFVPSHGFDHARTKFRLEGAHAKVACAACHVATRDAGGRRVTRYEGTPRECAACHARLTTGGNGES